MVLCGLGINLRHKDSYQLETPPGTEKGSDRQEMVTSCLAKGPLFKMYCFLGRLKDGNSYVPDHCTNDLNKIEYTLKGFMRLNMIQVDNEENEKCFKRWRRFFGTVKNTDGHMVNMIENVWNGNGGSDVRGLLANPSLDNRQKQRLKNIRKKLYGMFSKKEMEIIESKIANPRQTFTPNQLQSFSNNNRKKVIEENWKSFCANELGLDEGNIPTSWKSRINYKVFRDKESAKAFIDNCPLCQWKEENNQDGFQCPLLNTKNKKRIDKTKDGFFVLVQLQDYNLLSGNIKQASNYPNNFSEEDPNSLFSLAKLFRQYLYEQNSCIKPLGSSLDADKKCTLSNSVNLECESDKSLYNKALIEIKINESTKFHSGMDQGIAELTGRAYGNKASPQLMRKDADGDFHPYIQNESFRGLFKSTAEFILENSEFKEDNIGQANYTTSSYLKAFKKSKPEESEDEECDEEFNGLIDKLFGTTKNRSRIAITYHQSDSTSEVLNSKFACQILELDNNSNKLGVEHFKPKASYLQIILDKPTKKEINLILLTIDAISSGHFRVGKMTSRGFGVLRFDSYEMKTYDYELNEKTVEGKSGKQLFDQIIGG